MVYITLIKMIHPRLLQNLLLVLFFAVAAHSAPEEDLVDWTSLPGIPLSMKPTFRMYSGYLNPKNTPRFMFYIHYESQSNSPNDPLILWLNGGPGCSSMLGMLYEHGPFIFRSGSAILKENLKHSWNRNAHIIYLESPALVGFSYDTSGDKHTTDNQTANDNLHGLLSFYEKFPEHKQRSLFIAGESYAGVYVPLLAAKILEYNEAATEGEFRLPLRGFLVGNPYTHLTYDGLASDFAFLRHRGFWSEEIFAQRPKSCDTTPNDATCEDFVNKRLKPKLKGVNRYSLYDQCWENNIGHLNCTDNNGAHFWFMDPMVQKVLHTNPKSTNWTICSKELEYTRFNGSLYTYDYLLSKGLRIIVYSGDTDLVIPISGTQRWIESLALRGFLDLVIPTRPWIRPGKSENEPQLAGFITEYNRLTFVQVLGAGHMVPADKPDAAMAILRSLLFNERL
eukprot:TRINITY_DN9797_c0_g1_i3.p1 TRINITY_DN9797_c0_g1~~TRINITY_DN9797_c0_g1_i3.p1  ORF type:complete len:451 (-),score=80.60 TRINITY_DN9797_c0_g1_i3:56-1408(-)